MFRSPRIALLCSFLTGVMFAATLGCAGNGNGDSQPTPPPSSEQPRLSQLSDTTPVIGVSVGGRHRAYLLQAFLRPDHHVYNDLLGTVPITVTFCDLDNCVRVFSASTQNEPLDISVGGPNPKKARSMTLKVHSNLYVQETALPLNEGTAPFPYTTVEAVRTTWREWLNAHPDTDIYLGALPLTPADPTIPIAPPPEAASESQ